MGIRPFGFVGVAKARTLTGNACKQRFGNAACRTLPLTNEMYNSFTTCQKQMRSTHGQLRQEKHMRMQEPHDRPRSHLFSLRVWQEITGTDQSEWRGKIQLLSSGDVRYFREWNTLAPLLISMLADLDWMAQPATDADAEGPSALV
jgi:hypothetical protein